MDDIGPVAATATFKIDISKPRTAIMRKRLGGKLPIGEVKAHVSRGSYKFVSTRDLDIQIVSDGAVAEGSVNAAGKWMDLSCTFSFTNTSEMQKIKIKPKAKFHLFDKSTEKKKMDPAEQEALRKQRQEEKDAIKAVKQQVKAEKKRLKAEQKQAEAAERAAVKAAKEQRKAEEKAARKASKAARKAAKTE